MWTYIAKLQSCGVRRLGAAFVSGGLLPQFYWGRTFGFEEDIVTIITPGLPGVSRLIPGHRGRYQGTALHGVLRTQLQLQNQIP